ncbi:hypothetical protein RhiirA5_499975 [Rhizophagus irregularis]|uniref:Uncharacterized protein n=2 Tax=Rhizophagus irregularis TaxID=588596 RepID=A0A2N0PNM5_9GLOM|nr:hypothetical protein RhiirA5_499975 [Rhizophagus irregularis]
MTITKSIMKFKCLLLIFAFTIVLAEAYPPWGLKRDAEAEALVAVKRDADAEAIPALAVKRDADAEAWGAFKRDADAFIPY